MTLKRLGFNVLLVLIAVNLMALGEMIHALMMNWRPGISRLTRPGRLLIRARRKAVRSCL